MTPVPRITYVGHATILVEMDGQRILTDPLLRGRIAHITRQGRSVGSSDVGAVDAVLISHQHYDHLDMPSLRSLGRETRLIAPAGTGRMLERDGFRNVEELRKGDSCQVGSVTVNATYAHHAGNRRPGLPHADTLGYVLQGQRSVYFAGDTDVFPEMSDLAGSIDLALLPVWGWGPTLGDGHLNPERAAESLKLLRPKAAMPIHWGTYAPIGFGWMKPRFLSEPPRDFFAHAAAVAPDVDVHIVAPGERLNILN